MTTALLAMLVIVVSGTSHALEGGTFLDRTEPAIHASADLGGAVAELTVGHSCVTHCAAHVPLGLPSSVRIAPPLAQAKTWSLMAERWLVGRSPPRAERPPRV